MCSVFLTSGERSPYLRLLDWESGEERPLEGASVVADTVIARDGWIVLSYIMRAVALPDPAQKKSPVGLPGRHPVAHEDPSLVWLTDEHGVATPVDRGGRAGGPSITVPSGWLAAAYGDAWLQWDPKAGTSTYWSGDGVPSLFGRTYGVCVAGPRVLMLRAGDREADVLDLRDGRVSPVERRGFMRWDMLPSLSPDGTKAALSAQTADPGPMRPDDVPFDEWMRTKPDTPADPTRVMTVVDLTTASCSVVTGTFRNAALNPAWTADGRAFAFYIPFERRTTIGWVSLDTMALQRRLFPRRTGSPLLDMSGRL